MLSKVRKLLENHLGKQKSWLWIEGTVLDTNEKYVTLGSLGATVEGVVVAEFRPQGSNLSTCVLAKEKFRSKTPVIRES